ncbi:Nicotinate-nucleotide adenylyltransferase [Pseudobythopirellula maris]|uniref:Probable nicotinate-nucleotide adenylyltransferase n=1 Tax=Pseudobythopirellula maris TaxID=2527991 RepID=A0A5C5ZJK6_9BACT|nr:nicotinate-nucleotide adenylyltransferase [Pseudobythopirellula maris]TWT87360.1 Nicotinate-nucleotide adenylyltransferase [Pseudobythopirellula maris]
MRLGLFGGSFDPVHRGHLLLAECCMEQGGLDRVWFVPSAVQPHKPGGPVAGDADRVRMLRLALEGRPGMEVSTLEVERGEVSYSVDTLREIRRQLPDAELFFLMGADTLHDLPTWRGPAEVLALATPMVVCRPGEPEPDFGVLSGLVGGDRLAAIAASRVAMPATEVSSSDLRRRIAVGEPWREMTDAAVADDIEAHKLYGLGNREQ